MRKDAAALVVEGLKEAGIDFLTVLSESWLHEVHRQVVADPFFTVVPVANEADGVGICAGTWLPRGFSASRRATLAGSRYE